MNHIFYLHSNTCVISAYDIIEDLVSKQETVIIVSERNTKFSFFKGKVLFYDMQKIIDRYRKPSKNFFGKFLNYKKQIIPHCGLYAKEIIDNMDFVFYTPSYNMYSVKPFLLDQHCRGYYFIEEGFMAYLSDDTLRKHYNNRRYKGGRFLLDFVGTGDSYDYYVTNKFKGCYGLTDYSFPWCDNKVITKFDGYFSNLPYDDIDVNNLITTDWLSANIEILQSAFKAVVDKININRCSKIAIKFHPTAFINEKGKIDILIEYLHRNYDDIEFIILPSSFSVEALMYHRTVNIYCIFGVSSLQLYALMLKSRPFMVSKNEEIDIKEIESIPQFVEIATKDWEN